MPHPTQMSAGDTGLLVIDVQEKLLPKVHDAKALVRNIAFLIDGARLLNMPVQATEQYPKGLGATVPELAGRLPERPDKVAFSSCAVGSVVEAFHRAARPKVVLAGIETHVCVLHTALDLLAADFRVYVAADAVGSRYAVDHEYALRPPGLQLSASSFIRSCTSRLTSRNFGLPAPPTHSNTHVSLVVRMAPACSSRRRAVSWSTG